MLIKKITGVELSQVLTNPALSNGIDYAIVDVRDEDYVYGNINGCKNIPSSKFHNIEKVHDQVKDVPVLYFHCMLSQVRGPKCANKYSNFLDSKGIRKQIYVLEGGYLQFANQFSNVPGLVTINKPVDDF